MSREVSNAAEQKDRRKFTARAVLLAIMLLVIYPLSYGPVVLLVHRRFIDPHGPAGEVIAVIYAPLWWVIERVPGSIDIYLAYLNRWVIQP